MASDERGLEPSARLPKPSLPPFTDVLLLVDADGALPLPLASSGVLRLDGSCCDCSGLAA